MKRKLDTRFPAGRIKKIMQADEDVGKMAMAVPLLVSKALELFLQDLCHQTYQITLKKGAKAVNTLHLKECVHSFNVFDFLRDTVRNVPGLGGTDPACEDRSATKRRTLSEDAECGNEFKRIRTRNLCHTSDSGRGRGRGHGRGIQTLQIETASQCLKFEDNPDISCQNDENQKEHLEGSENVVCAPDSRTADGKDADKSVIRFGLNVESHLNGDYTPSLAGVPSNSSKKPSLDTKHEDISWIATSPVQLANLNKGMNEEEEDCDEEV